MNCGFKRHLPAQKYVSKTIELHHIPILSRFFLYRPFPRAITGVRSKRHIICHLTSSSCHMSSPILICKTIDGGSDIPLLPLYESESISSPASPTRWGTLQWKIYLYFVRVCWMLFWLYDALKNNFGYYYVPFTSNENYSYGSHTKKNINVWNVQNMAKLETSQ